MVYIYSYFSPRRRKKYPSVNGTTLLSFSISDHIHTVSHNTLRTATQIKRLKYAQVPETKIRNEDSNCTQSNSTYDKSITPYRLSSIRPPVKQETKCLLQTCWKLVTLSTATRKTGSLCTLLLKKEASRLMPLLRTITPSTGTT